MSPEAQRIAIAEACGWMEIRQCTCKRTPRGNYKQDGIVRSEHLPDYLNDLNAMHEAEKVLNPPASGCLTDASTHSKEWLEYSNQLAWVCPMGTWIRATAAQRAEAFLRTLGKWEESQ